MDERGDRQMCGGEQVGKYTSQGVGGHILNFIREYDYE